MANKDNSERIDRFLHEQMTPEENEAFLNDLRSDKALREEAQAMALLIKSMKEEQAQKDAETAEAVLSSSKAKRVSTVRWALSIAALFILVFGATLLWNRQSDTDALFDSYYTSYDMSSVRGGDDEAVVRELADLYNRIGTEEDIAPVIDRLQTIYDNIQSDNGDYADYGYYENDIAWYLALAYIKDHHIDKAKELLKPLAEDGVEEAKKLMEEME